MEIKLVTVLATALSSLAILSCIIAVPTIYNEVTDIWREIDLHMEQFKVL